MAKHGDCETTARAGNVEVKACGCVWIGISCEMRHMCEEGRALAQRIKSFFTDTDEGKARVADVWAEAQRRGNRFA